MVPIRHHSFSVPRQDQLIGGNASDSAEFLADAARATCFQSHARNPPASGGLFFSRGRPSAAWPAVLALTTDRRRRRAAALCRTQAGHGRRVTRSLAERVTALRRVAHLDAVDVGVGQHDLRKAFRRGRLSFTWPAAFSVARGKPPGPGVFLPALSDLAGGLGLDQHLAEPALGVELQLGRVGDHAAVLG